MPTLLTPGFSEIVRYRLTARDRILWDDAEYSWVDTTDREHVLRAPGIATERRIEHREFNPLLENGVVVVQENHWSAATALRIDRDIVCYEDLSDDEREAIMHRLRWVEAFERLYLVGEVRKSPAGYRQAVGLIADIMAVDEDERRVGADGRPLAGDQPAAGRTAPSPSQLGRWVRSYARSDGDPLALLKSTHRSGNRVCRLDAVVRRMIHRTAARYCMPNRPTVALLHERMARTIRRYNRLYGRDLKTPSVRALERAVAEIDDFEKMAGRHGIDYARRYFMPVFPAPVVSVPFERIEIDEWKVSLQVLLEKSHVFQDMSPKQRAAVKRERCWLTVAIDVATRCVVGVSLSRSEPSAVSSLSTLRSIIEDKDELRRRVGARTPWPCSGRPEKVIADKGSAFKANEFQWALRSLEIEPGRPPAGRPHFRGTIERFFGNLETRLISRFDGRTFSGVADKGEYDAGAFAALTVLELERALIVYICDVYHRMPRGELGGLSPAQAWNRLIAATTIRRRPEADEMRRAFGTRFDRRVGNRGVRVLGCFYRHVAITEAWEADGNLSVDVYLDESDVGIVSVRIREGVWVEATAEDRRFHGLSFDRITEDVETLLSQGFPAFVGVENSDFNAEVMDEALGDLDRMASRSRRRAGVFDADEFAKRIARARKYAEGAFRRTEERRDHGAHPAEAEPVVRGFGEDGRWDDDDDVRFAPNIELWTEGNEPADRPTVDPGQSARSDSTPMRSDEDAPPPHPETRPAAPRRRHRLES